MKERDILRNRLELLRKTLKETDKPPSVNIVDILAVRTEIYKSIIFIYEQLDKKEAA